MRQVVLTAVGQDRPGLVGELTGMLHEHGVNVADSRMVNLRGQFALIVLLELADESVDEVTARIQQIGDDLGMTIVIAPGSTGSTKGQGVPYRLRTYAMDQPGIVHRITHALHQHSINIEELETRLGSGAHSGTPLFTMELRMTVPATLSVKQLRDELETLCDSLNCDVDLEPA